jgi:hypothetical protein
VPESEREREREREDFDCARSESRHPRESKGADYRASRKPDAGGGCC